MKSKKKERKDEEEKTYSGEGMLLGVAGGSIIGVIIMIITNAAEYLPLCVSMGICIGLAIGANIKKSKNKN